MYQNVGEKGQKHADPDDPRLLLVGEELVAGQPPHAFLGHAVRAAEVAAVRDRDAEVGDAASEGVDQGFHSPVSVCDARHSSPRRA